MPQNPKLFIHNTLLEICFRIEDGLPIASKPYMGAIIISHLARAQTLYPVALSHFLFMGNHVHMIMVVKQPDNVKRFIEYFKKETAHAINRLLGRRKRTVWIKGYDSPIILDANKAMQRILYLYTNPQRADLVDKEEQYPNANSWNAFLAGGQIINCKRIPRTAITPLPKADMSFEAEQELADLILAQGEEDCTLEITPNAWLACFPETKNADPQKIRDFIVNSVRESEEELRATRTRPVVGAHALRLQRMDTPHTPKKFGRRSICLASLPETRSAYIGWFRCCCAERNSRIYHYPGGMFAPGGFLFTNVVPYSVPIVCESVGR